MTLIVLSQGYKGGTARDGFCSVNYSVTVAKFDLTGQRRRYTYDVATRHLDGVQEWDEARGCWDQARGGDALHGAKVARDAFELAMAKRAEAIKAEG